MRPDGDLRQKLGYMGQRCHLLFVFNTVKTANALKATTPLSFLVYNEPLSICDTTFSPASPTNVSVEPKFVLKIAHW